MSEQSDFNLPEEIEGAVKAIFSHPKPDQAFVDRLGHQLSTQVEQFTTHQRKVLIPVSPLAWGVSGLIFILLIVWGIKNLIPRIESSVSSATTPSPIVSPTPVMKPTQAEGIAPSPIASPTQAIGPIQTENVEEMINLPVGVGMPIPWPETVITASNAYQVTQLGRIGRGPIQGVAWSPDGKSLAIASSTGIYLYETENFNEIKKIANNENVNGVVFLPDGVKLVALEGSNVKIWEIESGKELHSFPGRAEWRGSFVISPDGSLLATSSGYDTIKLWDTNSGNEVATLISSKANAMLDPIAFSSDGKTLIASADLGTIAGDGSRYYAGPAWIRVWDVASRTLLRSLPDCKGYDMVFSPDSQIVVVKQKAATILCDIESGSVIKTLPFIADFSYAFSPDGTILTAAVNKAIMLWKVATMKEILSIESQDELVYSIAFSPDGRKLASTSLGSVKIWDSANGQELCTLNGHNSICNEQALFGLEKFGDTVNDLAFSPDKKILARLQDESLILYDVKTGMLLAELETQFGRRVAFSPDSKLLAVCGGHYLDSGVVIGVEIWDVAKQELRLKLDGFTEAVQSVAFSPDGLTLATGEGNGWGYQGAAKLWNIATGELLQEFGSKLMEEDTGYLSVFDVAFSPDGSVLAVANAGGSVLLWDVIKQMQKTILTTTAGSVMRISLSPDGRLLASVGKSKGYDTNDLRLWDLAPGETLFILEGQGAFNPDPMIHEGLAGARSVAFSPDGRILASVGYDGNVRLWDVRTGEALATLNGDFSTVAFSPDGTLLATGGYLDTVRLWGIPTGASVPR